LRTISHSGKTLAILVSIADVPEGLNFVTDDSSFLQVGTWRYDSGKLLPPHIHNLGVKREVDRTQEVIYVARGRLRAKIFSEEGEKIEDLELTRGDILVLLGGGHGYDILDDRTQVLEVKNGPYIGPELDRHRIRESA
jgi:hypothetical protein